jgi:hypothetical protein
MAQTAMQKLRIERFRVGTGRQWSLNDGRTPNVRGLRVARGTGYNRVEGNRRASRNGLVSDLPPEILTSRFATFASLTELVHSTRALLCTRAAAATAVRLLPAPHGSTMIPDRARPLPNIFDSPFSCGRTITPTQPRRSKLNQGTSKTHSRHQHHQHQKVQGPRGTGVAPGMAAGWRWASARYSAPDSPYRS